LNFFKSKNKIKERNTKTKEMNIYLLVSCMNKKEEDQRKKQKPKKMNILLSHV